MFYLPKEDEKYIHTEFVCPLSSSTDNKIIFRKIQVLQSSSLDLYINYLSPLKTICITRQYEEGACENTQLCIVKERQGVLLQLSLIILWQTASNLKEIPLGVRWFSLFAQSEDF